MKQKELILFLIFVVFPFGQLFKFGHLSLLDLLVALFVIFTLFSKKLKIPIYFWSVFSILAFSLVFGSLLFSLNIAPGTLYLVRLITYLLFWLCLADFILNTKSIEEKQRLANCLLVALVFVSFFGLVQYFVIPDTRVFFAFGWDDHLNRLLGTFLDPGFASIIITFGALVSLVKYIDSRKKIDLLLFLFFLIALVLTFSRAGYLAFLAGLVYLLVSTKKYLHLVAVFFVCLTIVTAFLIIKPKGIGEGMNLARNSSITQRFTNFNVGIKTFLSSPLFGVGYNNLCAYKQKFLGASSANHACSGFDNGNIFLLSTTGFLGLLIFMDFGIRIWNQTANTYFGQLFKVLGTALVVHSQVSNSIFYPWVMVLLGVVYSLSRQD